MMALAVPLLCSLTLLAGAAFLLRSAVFAAAKGPIAPAMRWLLPGLAVMYLAGIWWGVPWAGWGPDEIPPDVFLDALGRHYSGGWHDKYPPVHFYLNGVLYLPFVAAARMGWVDLSGNAVQIALLLVSRALSTLMAIGAVCAVYIAGDDLYQASGAVFAAAIAGVTLPFVFYAKLANVDVPYLFWFAWSIVFYARTITRGGTANAVAFAVTAATAVETKDQAYGFYLLPFVHALVVRRRETAIAIAAGILTFVVESNVIVNPHGFVDHVRALADVGSDLRFEVPGARLTRQATIWRLSLVSTVFSMTWLGAGAAAAGLATEIRLRRHWWLVLPMLSYYLFFLSTITSVFDRYLLGDYMILAIAAGGWIGGVIDARPASRRLRLAIAAAGVAVMAWYGASIDLVMINESRYPAARWLREHASPDTRIALLGPRAYLPSVDPSRVQRLSAVPAATAPADLPDFVVANAQVMQRHSMAAMDREWWTWLTGGGAPYRVVRTFTARPNASLLSYTVTFTNGVEDEYTNLDKVAPPIVIYQRTTVAR